MVTDEIKGQWNHFALNLYSSFTTVTTSTTVLLLVMTSVSSENLSQPSVL